MLESEISTYFANRNFYLEDTFSLSFFGAAVFASSNVQLTTDKSFAIGVSVRAYVLCVGE